MLLSRLGKYLGRLPHATPPSARLAAALMSSLSLDRLALMAASTLATPDRSLRRPISPRQSSARCWDAAGSAQHTRQQAQQQDVLVLLLICSLVLVRFSHAHEQHVPRASCAPRSPWSADFSICSSSLMVACTCFGPSLTTSTATHCATPRCAWRPPPSPPLLLLLRSRLQRGPRRAVCRRRNAQHSTQMSSCGDTAAWQCSGITPAASCIQQHAEQRAGLGRRRA
jgi:hypothetical protein